MARRRALPGRECHTLWNSSPDGWFKKNRLTTATVAVRTLRVTQFRHGSLFFRTLLRPQCSRPVIEAFRPGPGIGADQGLCLCDREGGGDLLHDRFLDNGPH